MIRITVEARWLDLTLIPSYHSVSTLDTGISMSKVGQVKQQMAWDIVQREGSWHWVCLDKQQPAGACWEGRHVRHRGNTSACSPSGHGISAKYNILGTNTFLCSRHAIGFILNLSTCMPFSVAVRKMCRMLLLQNHCFITPSVSFSLKQKMFLFNSGSLWFCYRNLRPHQILDISHG